MNKFTWGEIQIETCKKMFLNTKKITVDDIPTLKNDNNYRTYFNAMPQAANEGIAEIVKRGKPYIKTFSFTHKINENLLGDQLKVFEHTYEDLSFDTFTGKAYYFEVDNKATVEIYVDNVLTTTLNTETSNPGKFVIQKGFITNPDNKPVRIVFKGDFPYKFRNVCIYGLNYDYDNDQNIENIPRYSQDFIINMEDEVEDYYKIYKFYYQGRLLINNTDYHMMDHSTIIIDNFLEGTYVVKYESYPEKITDETLDETEIKLEPEMAVILPLYMASELYKDDDLSLSTVYRNQFEAAVDNIYPKNNDLKFTSKSGWC